MLTSTGVAGRAWEAFHDMEPDLAAGWKQFATEDIGINLSAKQMEQLWPFAQLERHWTKWLWMRRRDRWQVAVSAYLAAESGVWVNPRKDCRNPNRDYNPKPAPFNEEKIVAHHIGANQREDEWAGWFEIQAIQPLEIWYEDLSDRPVQIVYHVLDYLGISYSGYVDDTRMEIQRNTETIEWAERLCEQYGPRITNV